LKFRFFTRWANRITLAAFDVVSATSAWTEFPLQLTWTIKFIASMTITIYMRRNAEAVIKVSAYLKKIVF
jgi:hypothetical protein